MSVGVTRYLQCTGQFQATESDPIHYVNCIGMEKPDSLTLLIMCALALDPPWGRRPLVFVLVLQAPSAFSGVSTDSNSLFLCL